MKDKAFYMRCSADHKEAWKAAARRQGLKLSEWVNRTLMERAKYEARRARIESYD